MSRYGNQYAISDRVALEIAAARAKELEELRAKVKDLEDARAQVNVLADEVSYWRGLALAHRYQVKHPGTSLDDAIAATQRRPIPQEPKHA
jgi:hypothetical protein